MDMRRCLCENDFKKCIGSHWHTLSLACVPQIDAMNPNCAGGRLLTFND